MDYLTLTIGKQKNIALIAHDSKKRELIGWCDAHKEILKHHFLCGTGTTARMITDATGLPVKGYNSGPLGGDQQIGAKIVEGRVDFVVFFSDPLTAQPHDPDVKALLRIAQVYDIPIANNKATADFLITSPFMNSEYEHSGHQFPAEYKGPGRAAVKPSVLSLHLRLKYQGAQIPKYQGSGDSHGAGCEAAFEDPQDPILSHGPGDPLPERVPKAR